MACIRPETSEEYADFIINLFVDKTLRDNLLGENCYQDMGSGYISYFKPLSLVDYSNIMQYGYGAIPNLYGIMNSDISLKNVREMDYASLNRVMEESGITRLQNQPYLQLKGQGTVIGIIDTGINIEDEDFRYSNGDTRILSLWDMTDDAGISPAGVSFGSEYRSEEINEILKRNTGGNQYPGHDFEGHGNFLAKIAAGNRGIGREALIVAVKLKPAKQYLRDFFGVKDGAAAYQENDIMLAADYIRSVAFEYNMPFSLLIGLGTNSLAHDGFSPLSSLLENIVTTSGTFVSAPAGNEGNRRMHYAGRTVKNQADFSAPDGDNTGNVLYADSAEIRIPENTDRLTMQIWGQNPQIFSMSIVSPTGEILQTAAPRNGRVDRYRLVFENTQVIVNYELVESYSGDQLILIRFISPTPGIWKINISQPAAVSYVTEEFNGVFHMYLPLSEFVNNDLYFLKPDPDVTITDPGNSKAVMTTSAVEVDSGELFIASGRGFTRINAIKPDICSPVSRDTVGDSLGTAYGAAVVAGAAAQFLTWGITLENDIQIKSSDIKSYLIRGAVRKYGEVYPNRQTGFGQLNVYNAFLLLRS